MVRDPAQALAELRGKQKPDDEENGEAVQAITAFDIDVTDTRGVRYAGRFLFKVPTIGEQIQIGALKAIYLPGGAVNDPQATLFNEMVCYLEVTLQKPRPEWYKPIEMYDALPIQEVYKRALAHVERFLGRSRADAKQRAGDATPQEADDSGDEEGDRSAVDADVPHPGKRREVLASHVSGSR